VYSSSISSSFLGVSGVSCDQINVGGTRWGVPPSAAPLPPEYDVVVWDHGTLGLMAAFLKESMRRDAIIGVKIVHALRDTS